MESSRRQVFVPWAEEETAGVNRLIDTQWFFAAEEESDCCEENCTWCKKWCNEDHCTLDFALGTIPCAGIASAQDIADSTLSHVPDKNIRLQAYLYLTSQPVTCGA